LKGKGAGTITIGTTSAKLKYSGAIMSASATEIVNTPMMRETSSIYEAYNLTNAGATADIMTGVTLKKFALDHSSTYVYNGDYELVFTRAVEIADIKVDTRIHHNLGISLGSGGSVSPTGGNWNNIEVDTSSGVIEVTPFLGALSNLGFNPKTDGAGNLLTLKSGFNVDGYKANHKDGTPISAANNNMFANGMVAILNNYEARGKLSLLPGSAMPGSFADGRAVSTSTALVQNGQVNSSYPAKISAAVWQKMSIPVMNAVITGTITSGQADNKTFVNVGFTDDQDNNWLDTNTRGVIVFSGHAPDLLRINQGSESTTRHAYVILNKIRTDGSGANIRNAGAIDLRNVPDNQIQYYGQYSSVPGDNSGLLIFRNKTVKGARLQYVTGIVSVILFPVLLKNKFITFPKDKCVHQESLRHCLGFLGSSGDGCEELSLPSEL
jgi:hypothetical protein